MGYTTAELIMIPLALVVVCAAGVILGYTLRHRSVRVREIPLQVLAIMILVLEVVKQTYLIATGTWTTWAIPMHFCSFFLIWFSFALFSQGKWHQLAYACCIAGGILVTLMLIVSPRMIVNTACENIFASFSSFHTFVFHFTVVAYWVWILCLRVYEPQRNHIWRTALFYFVSFLLIIAAAYLFNTNFTNVLQSDVPLLKNVQANAGQVVYLLVMLVVGVGGITMTATASYFLASAINDNDLN